MAKKKAGRSAKKSSAKRTAAKAKSAAKKQPARKANPAAKNAAATKRAVKRKSVAKTAKKAASKPKSRTSKRPAALGRPKVPGTAELDQMFLKDYEARQVFAFLGVKTIKELEEHPPDEIIERLTGPMVRTVNRIRKALAVNNRFLAGDQKFAVEFAKQIR